MSDNNNNNMAYDSPAARDLWLRLQQWSPDRLGAAHPLSQRLQLENGWTADFTRRAIDEYRRFAFLAMVAGHTVTPSDEVDQVWHAHLLYSRDYWDDFCPRVLGKPLHHQPSDGGPEEAARYSQLYRLTLASYERVFGEVPPQDLWPAPAVRFGGRFQRVNLRTHRVLPHLDLPGRLRPLLARTRNAAAALAAAVGLSGCARFVDSSLPGSPGPGTFLFVYLLMIVAGVALAAGLRRALTGSAAPGDSRFRRLDLYALAYLAGRRRRVLETAAGRLHQQGCIAFPEGNQRWEAVQPPPADAHPVERSLFNHVLSGKTIHTRQLSPDLNAAIASLHRTLQADGLIPGRPPGLLAALGGAATLAGVAVVGGLRWWHGMIQGKPVLFVALLTLVAGGLALYLLKPPRLTGAGRHALRQTRLRVPRSKPIGQLDPMLMTVLALFGLGALADNALADLKAALQPPSSSSSGGDGGDGGDGGGCGGGCGG